MSRTAICMVAWLTYLTLHARNVQGRPAETNTAPVVVDYFFEPGCPACERIARGVLPTLEARYAGCIRIAAWDIGLATNFMRLVAYQDALGDDGNQPVSMVVDRRTMLSGYARIEAGIFQAIDAALARRAAADWQFPSPSPAPSAPAVLAAAERRIRRFTIVAVAVAGLGDGLNPCAIATLIFLMSLLSVSRVAGRGRLLLGLSYCLAAFVTYLALGIGILHSLKRFYGIPLLKWGIEIALIAALSVAACLSFRDAWTFHRRHAARDVLLKLPRRITLLIHRILRQGVSNGRLILGGVTMGAAVTALETVCTGQVYVPTLALVIDASAQGALVGRAWSLLLLYNGMFILPLGVAFAMSGRGVGNERFLSWSRDHVPASKALLGSLFLGLAALTAMLALR
jgi:hypothetical protein